MATCPHSADSEPRRLIVQQGLREKNDRQAEHNRALFQSKGVLTLNLVSSPGSGKTALLERTFHDRSNEWRGAVIVGDLATDRDAQRLHQANIDVVQITTGTICHLEASMIARAVDSLTLDALDIVVIENVGNLVCPAGYDLGESLRIVMLSVTEGEDKPLKYPHIFRSAHVILLSKIDLAEVVGFDRTLAWDYLRRINPTAPILELSARSGAGMAEWYELLQRHMPHVRK